MNFYAVCPACARLLQRREFCSIGLFVEAGEPCVACDLPIPESKFDLDPPDHIVADYYPVTADQLAEIARALLAGGRR